MDEPQGNRRARRRSLVVLTVPGVALASVMALLAAGIAPGRLRPVAAFLAIATTASLVHLVSMRLSARRARRLRASKVPWGVRLVKPLWLSAPEASIPLELGGVLAALLALVGCPGIGAGVMVTFVGIALLMPFVQLGMSPRALTFEADGLRVHARRATFVIPWASITGVETVGPDHMQFTTLRLADAGAIVATATPGTPRVRARVSTLLHDAMPRGASLMLMHWTAGLDGRSLARTLELGRHGSGGQVN
jgi:hypothetical protein